MTTRSVSSISGGRVRRCSLGLCLAAVALLGATTGAALGQDVLARLPATLGPDPDQPIWETDLAVGGDRTMAVFNMNPRLVAPEMEIGYGRAQYDEGWAWTGEGVIPTDPNVIVF
ncbi:MAG TPA: hypothetical protein VM487_01255, partial [Phycisphaerae bacterium]|nr:hypothetical protein [Phycisphaerae bacterium]